MSLTLWRASRPRRHAKVEHSVEYCRARRARAPGFLSLGEAGILRAAVRIVHSNPSTVPEPAFRAYTHAVRVDMGPGALLFVSGQAAVGPDGTIVGPGDLARQSEEVFDRLGRILAEHEAGFEQVVSIRTYLTDLSRLREYGAVRRRYLSQPLPTSTTVEVSRLVHPEALVEIDILAALPSGAG